MIRNLKFLAPLALVAALASPALAQQANGKAAPLAGIAAMKPPISLSTMLMVVLGLSDFEAQIVHDRCYTIQADPKASVDDKDTCALFHIAEIMMPRGDGDEQAKVQ